MNLLFVAKIIGTVLYIEAALMLLPLVAALIYNESIMPFVVPIAIGAALGIGSRFITRRSIRLQSKEGLVATGLTWLFASLTGMLPFLISGTVTSPIDAFFETVSGFTTTGSTILTDIESVDRSILLWRSFTHWIGGMGLLVFMSAIVRFKSGSQMNLMKAESPGPVVSKLVPKAQDTARLLYYIYTAMTIVTLSLLLILRMPLFDALCITFGAAGTGGFGVLNDSCANYTLVQQLVIGISMFVFGINFNFFFLILMRKARQAFAMEEVRLYALIALAATAIISWNLMSQGGVTAKPLLTIHNAAFHVSSIMTTTGYALEDINNWPHLSQMVIIVLMLVGACAGSTGGGYKISRLLIMTKAFARDLAVQLKPNMVKRVHIDGKAVDEELIRSTGVYTFVYIVIMAVSVLLIMPEGKDGLSTVTAVITTFNNIGPGIGINGTMGSFAAFSGFTKLVLSMDMLIGRLEILPILGLLSRETWRRF